MPGCITQCITSGMVQPKEPPLSFRPGDERRARIEAWANEHKVSRHLAILTLIDAGLRALAAPALKVQHVPPEPVFWPSGAAVLPEHTEDPGVAATTVRAKSPPAPKREPFKTRLKGEWKAP